MATPKGKSLLNEPSEFNGDKSEFKEWRRTLFTYLRDPRNGVTEDSEHIDISMSYIRGPKVRDWNSNFYDENFNEETETWKISWKEFKDELNKQFLDSQHALSAQEKLEHLGQGQTSAEEFFTKFETLLLEAGYDRNSPYVIWLIKKAISQRTIDQIYGS